MEIRGSATPTIELATQEAKLHNFCTNCMEVNGNFWILRYFSTEVALCRHLLKFRNEAWSTLDQLSCGCGTPPTFPLVSLDFEYLALAQVNTFFWWRLYNFILYGSIVLFYTEQKGSDSGL